MNSYITSFKLHVPKFIIPQKETIEWLLRYSPDHLKDQIEKYSIKDKYIAHRAIYTNGIGNFEPENDALFDINKKNNPTLRQRSIHNQKKIEYMTNEIYKEIDQAPDHLNHITCSHYESPSSAQKLVVGKEWFDKTKVTHLYHMGCYAALPAVRVAKSYISDGAHHIDNLHTEICSSHFDKDDESVEQTIMNTLFADGAIKYSIVSADKFEKEGFKILSMHEELVPNSGKDMSWKLTETSFAMTVSKRVPVYLARKIEDFFKNIYKKAGLNFKGLKAESLFAIHPGGPKIIDLIQDKLELSEKQVMHSKEILNKRGNMSSATLPHIWNEILNDQNVKNKYIATVAFGPGLTMTGALLELCRD